jgi:regulatory protein
MLAGKKYEQVRGNQHIVRKKKTLDYMLQKGYEPDLVMKELNKLV